MLPGFRFLFAAILLSTSVLVFGLGAAALLRAAHEEVVSTPSWRAAPETMFAQQADASRPVLAMLSVEPPGASSKGSDKAAAAPAEPTTGVSVPALPEPATAQQVDDPSPPETGKPVTPATGPQTPGETAAAASETLALADAASRPAAEQTLSPAREAAPGITEPVNALAQSPSDPPTAEPLATPAPLEQAAAGPASAPAPAEPLSASAPAEQAPAAATADAASTKVATLGGPAVSTEQKPTAKTEAARPHHHGEKKHQQARRLVQHRRVAQRARAATPPAAQQTPSFFQPSTGSTSGG